MRGSGGSDDQSTRPGHSEPPAISVPKGGGAIRGIGEKFAANPVTGTESLSVPIPTSPGRSGFGPQISLAYDSGAGNGPFGFGWGLSLPQITRKTDKGLPRYLDAEDSDEFILSGAEDLVPVYRTDTNGNYVPTASGGFELHEELRDTNGNPPQGDEPAVYRVRRYRPRIEGLFARIERWTHLDTGEVHWRSISRDNITTVYGSSDNSRIADPADPARVFSWLIAASWDDKGNAIVYGYKPEDAVNVDASQANERNRSRTASRYLKHIGYGTRTPKAHGGDWLRGIDPQRPDPGQWMFEVVFDYGEHDPDDPRPADSGDWLCRRDPVSSYRAGFEVRTYRLCQRVLMFHHFKDEDGVGENCLVRSTDFRYRDESGDPADRGKGQPVASFIASVTQSGYRRKSDGGYLKRSLPPLEFEYSEPVIDETIRELDPAALENLPAGLGGEHRWVDLDGEGLSGILTEQADGWFYKANLGNGRFGPLQPVAARPSLAALNGGSQQLLDLAGDGQLDLVELDGPTPGFYERTHDAHWETLRSFEQLPSIPWDEPNLRFVDLNGDGHADVLITENEVFTWHASLAEDGFGPARRVPKPRDEERGPRLVFADGDQSVYLADMSGDGLVDLVRIRNGEVCYWPNLGYGRFGAKVSMDAAPWLDTPDQFDQRRIRLADIDGSGNNDILYLLRDGVRVYFNQSGNRWSAPRTLRCFPPTDDLTDVAALDLLGNGTACLVWSSPLPGDARRPLRYIDLMGRQKPHLLVAGRNNLGAETHIRYAPSTKFYLQDRQNGRPWITRLPFPVHVVERVETWDCISRNRFVTRYAYHHGYFDGIEREFRGFGMVEQWDSESFDALVSPPASLSPCVVDPNGDEPAANVAAESHIPPVHTKTWYHTGIYVDRRHVSDFFAGLLDENDRGEYYRERGWGKNDDEPRKHLLDDTPLPDGLTPEEEREACRALKGTMLRQEVYADDAGPDATAEEILRANTPYTVTEHNVTIRRLQPQGGNRHAVFLAHPREALTYHYERNAADPRVGHELTLEVDEFGNVLRSASVAYGRRQDATDVSLGSEDKLKQRLIHVTYTENRFTNAIDESHAYRTPLPAESSTYELRRAEQDQAPDGPTQRFGLEDVRGWVEQAADGHHEIDYQDLDFARAKSAFEASSLEAKRWFRRLIEQVRTLYRRDDLTGLSPLGEVQSLALPGESYKLAFTPGLLEQVFQRPLDQLRPPDAPPPERLLPASVADMLGGQGGAQGGYVEFEGDGRWWIPSGRVYYSDDPEHTATEEQAEAEAHFYLPRRYRDPFGQDTRVTYDGPLTSDAPRYDLLATRTEDALGNSVQAENDYRVLQPRAVTDPNRNRTLVAFDALGLVVATAVQGKEEGVVDNLDGLEPDPTRAQLDAFYDAEDPHQPAVELLGNATTRILYDLDRFQRARADHPDDPAQWLPPYAATLARETHVSEPLPRWGQRIQIGFSYSDGFGREIQKKIQAEPGPLIEGGPVVQHRWVGSGWTVFNNKGKPVRQYEPFFSQLPERRHRFEFGVEAGVSPILFYDPLGRVVATLHPNHSYEKVVFDPWQQTTWDVSDTLQAQTDYDPAHPDPGFNAADDPDVGQYFARLAEADYLPTWYAQRMDPVAAGARWPDAKTREAERKAAEKAIQHAATPSVAHLDSLGRPFLTQAHNGFGPDGTPILYPTRVELDIEGNQRAVRDALGRLVMRYHYDLLGNRIHQASMEAGERWMLNDVTGKPIQAWDSRGHAFRTEYDPLRRPIRTRVTGADPTDPGRTLLTERLVYGEQHPDAEAQNLRGRPWLHLDQAGLVANEAHDFKGNLLRASRRLARDYKRAIDWTAVDAAVPADSETSVELDHLDAALADRLEAETFSTRTAYDALNRPIQLVPPRSQTAGTRRNVIQPEYNEANLLESLHVWLDQPGDPGDLLNPERVAPSPVGVHDIDYDAKGQRLRIDYKNGASTHYDYDPETFRLTHLYTRRGASFAEDCENPQPPPPTIAAPEPPPSANKPCGLQNLHYSYDPAGNITAIRDDAQQTIFFRNHRVDPSTEYTYDAIYRLIEAEGREHLGLTPDVPNAPTPHSHTDAPRVGLPLPGDCRAMGSYREHYVYDAVGNFEQVQHRGTDPQHPGWTRTYDYDEPSLIESGQVSNRLSSTTVDGEVSRYGYDPHGSMTRMPHLPEMRWDFRDQLQEVDLLGGGRAYYVYDASGQRVRKVHEHNGATVEERIYVGGFEVYRRRNGNGLKLERETLHVMDDKQRIALVETKTVDTQDAADLQVPAIRYQLGNHLGSASLELDEDAAVITYEEYYPYGSTSFQAGRSAAEVSLKRYRYTGKERDKETGFNYHHTRYHASWLGRWISPDTLAIHASGEVDPNLYAYVRGKALVAVDPMGEDQEEVVPNAANSGCMGGGGGPATLSEKPAPMLPDPKVEAAPPDPNSGAEGAGGGGQGPIAAAQQLQTELRDKRTAEAMTRLPEGLRRRQKQLTPVFGQENDVQGWVWRSHWNPSEGDYYSLDKSGRLLGYAGEAPLIPTYSPIEVAATGGIGIGIRTLARVVPRLRLAMPQLPYSPRVNRTPVREPSHNSLLVNREVPVKGGSGMVKARGYIAHSDPIPGTSGKPINTQGMPSGPGTVKWALESAPIGCNHGGCAEARIAATTENLGLDTRLLHIDPWWVKGQLVRANAGLPVPAHPCPTCAYMGDELGISFSVTDANLLSPVFRRYAVGGGTF